MCVNAWSANIHGGKTSKSWKGSFPQEKTFDVTFTAINQEP